VYHGTAGRLEARTQDSLRPRQLEARSSNVPGESTTPDQLIASAKHFDVSGHERLSTAKVLAGRLARTIDVPPSKEAPITPPFSAFRVISSPPSVQTWGEGHARPVASCPGSCPEVDHVTPPSADRSTAQTAPSSPWKSVARHEVALAHDSRRS